MSDNIEVNLVVIGYPKHMLRWRAADFSSVRGSATDHLGACRHRPICRQSRLRMPSARIPACTYGAANDIGCCPSVAGTGTSSLELPPEHTQFFPRLHRPAPKKNWEERVEGFGLRVCNEPPAGFHQPGVLKFFFLY